MRVRVTFNGRRCGAIGITYTLGAWLGEGETREAAIEDARTRCYNGGHEHLTITKIVEVEQNDA